MKNILFRVIAALSFFTRLPFWRLANVPKEYYERVVPLWPVAGWVTGFSFAGTFFICSNLFSVGVSVIMALIVRVLVTGALHEDGFADFCDGFGGGTSRERTLEIMKDSHIGTYGVLGLILYFLLMYSVLNASWLRLAVPDAMMMGGYGFRSDLVLQTGVWRLPALMFIADVMSKAVSATLIYSLPYARKETEAKNRLVYSSTPFSDKFITLSVSLIPCTVIAAVFMADAITSLCFALLVILAVRCMLVSLMRHRIQGYTGDCCGAMFIVCEALFHLAFVGYISCLGW